MSEGGSNPFYFRGFVDCFACARNDAKRGSRLHFISRRLPRRAIERIEQPLAPGVDRIVRGEQPERLTTRAHWKPPNTI